MPVFTPEDLVLYLYEETSPQQTAAIEKAQKEDWTLREKLSVIKASIQKLEKIKMAPQTEVILKILNYARDKNVEAVK